MNDGNRSNCYMPWPRPGPTCPRPYPPRPGGPTCPPFPPGYPW